MSIHAGLLKTDTVSKPANPLLDRLASGMTLIILTLQVVMLVVLNIRLMTLEKLVREASRGGDGGPAALTRSHVDLARHSLPVVCRNRER